MVYQSSMFIFGGCDKRGVHLNEVFELSLETLEWTHIINAPGGLPRPPSYMHSSVLVGNW